MSFQVTSQSKTKPTIAPKTKWTKSSTAYYPNQMHIDPCFSVLDHKSITMNLVSDKHSHAIKKLLADLQDWQPWFKSSHKRKDGTVPVSDLGFATPLMDLRSDIWWQSTSNQTKGQQECQQLRETCGEQAGSGKKLQDESWKQGSLPVPC